MAAEERSRGSQHPSADWPGGAVAPGPAPPSSESPFSPMSSSAGGEARCKKCPHEILRPAAITHAGVSEGRFYEMIFSQRAANMRHRGCLVVGILGRVGFFFVVFVFLILTGNSLGLEKNIIIDQCGLRCSGKQDIFFLSFF